jgi:L-lactate dehydrogenase complex protein LldG
VAETGTLVLASSAANPASLAFLPEFHLVAVPRDGIVASFEDAFARLRARAGPDRFPRAVNLVSGPSRTGDIGGRIVKGAHGPRRLAVLVYGPTPKKDPSPATASAGR